GKPATEPMTSEMRDIKIKEAFEKYSSAPLPGVAAPVRTIQISVTANQEHPAETTATASESETDDAKFIAPDERFQPSIDTVRSSLEALQEPPKEEEPLQPIVDEVPQPIKRAAGHFHDMIN
ncbi:MAG: hypothetical protein K2Z81_08340, partial [Cyanobacteria bacterium]|nr:hypothetical protein [Cyanobacteriota bacterium]